jgi:hypothetical protein
MITWLQNATGKHNRIIFGFLLVIIVVSFVFYGFAGRGALTGGPAYMYQGVNLNDPAVRKRFNDAVFFGQMTGQRMDPNGLVQRVAELALADGLGIPAPSAVEIRRIAREATAAADSKGNDGLNKFLEFAAKQLDASDLDVRARFETYIKDTWRIQKALGALAGSGHATASQIKRILDRERTKWTVDVATLSAAGFKPDVKVDEAKVKEAFNANIEDYRLPARVAVTAVTIAATAADTAPVTDDEIINMGYNQAEKFKFETGKVKEQALAKRAELEKLVRAERAITNLAGQVSDELAAEVPDRYRQGRQQGTRRLDQGQERQGHDDPRLRRHRRPDRRRRPRRSPPRRRRTHRQGMAHRSLPLGSRRDLHPPQPAHAGPPPDLRRGQDQGRRCLEEVPVQPPARRRSQQTRQGHPGRRRRRQDLHRQRQGP